MSAGLDMEALIERARNHKITPAERFEQRVSFVFSGAGEGVTREQVRAQLAEEYGDPVAYEAEIASLRAELAAAREALKAANEPHWFYLGDDCSSDRCRDSIDECIYEDFEYENRGPRGDHVLLISGARPVPDIWLALHYYTEAEKDARDSDDEYAFTEHKSKEEAETAIRALKEPPHA